MVECGRVLVMRDDKGVVHAAMVVEHGIDRRDALHQDEADPSRIEEGHVPARNGGQMVTADNFCVKPRASRDVAHGDAEMGNGLDRNHVTLPRPSRSRNRATSFFASSSRPCTTKTLDSSSAGVATAIGASPGAPRSAISSITMPKHSSKSSLDRGLESLNLRNLPPPKHRRTLSGQAVCRSRAARARSTETSCETPRSAIVTPNSRSN